MTALEVETSTVAAETGESKKNEVNGPMSGLQANDIHGDVTMVDARPTKADLVTLWLNADEIADLKEQFVPNTQFDRACTILRDSPVVVLCGIGTGRTFTGRKLLLHHGHSQIAHLNGSRGLGSVEAQELRNGAGYLWRAGETGATAFTGSHLEQVAHVMRSVDSRLVIIVDHESYVPREAGYRIVRMSPPNAATIALAVIRRRDEDVQVTAREVLNGELGIGLNEDDPPDKAVRAAELAIAVANKELTTAAAIELLTENIDQTIATTYQDWSVLEFSMMLAVAVLENQPYDEVAEYASELDELIRTAELPPDEELSPREVFAKSKQAVLRDVGAKTVVREHPRHPGLQEETIRFVRQDWAEAALCHVWREYLSVHRILLSWLCVPALLDRFPSACINALCWIIAKTPAHEPLRMIDQLAASRSHAKRKLASWTLVRLAKDHDLQPVVDQTLTEWVDTGSPTRKATAAMTYALRYSKTDPSLVLDRLHAILVKTDSVVARMSVYHSLLFTLEEAPPHRSTVLSELCAWSETARRTGADDGPRQVALKVGMWVSGLTPNANNIYVEAAEMITEHSTEVAVLAERALLDRDFGPVALDHLFKLAGVAYYSTAEQAEQGTESAGVELVRSLTLLAPDLRWWASWRKVVALCRRHPTRRKPIRWIFKVARRHQRWSA